MAEWKSGPIKSEDNPEYATGVVDAAQRVGRVLKKRVPEIVEEGKTEVPKMISGGLDALKAKFKSKSPSLRNS